jgi:hypothetical protein
MDVTVWGMVHSTLLVLPHMRERHDIHKKLQGRFRNYDRRAAWLMIMAACSEPRAACA